jgi:3-isopropylmalate/(R)-2-methylmalate dehydratase small subunit
MQKVIRGKAFVLGDDIDTDQIIPAEYLSYDPSDPEERKYFGRYALAGVPRAEAGLPEGHGTFVEPDSFESLFSVVVAGRNFGCGSSREHAPLALAQAGVQAVVAESYARIFYRNSINGGYLLPLESLDRLIGSIRTGDDLEIDTAAWTLTDGRSGEGFPLKPLGDVGPIVEAGGIFAYARQTGML